jgi:hypothetical protein
VRIWLAFGVLLLGAGCTARSSSGTSTVGGSSSASSTVASSSTIYSLTTTPIAATTTTKTTLATDPSSGWVGTFDDGAVYISWVETDGRLTGSVLLVTRTVGATETKPANRQFVGQHTGDQVSLDITGLGLWQGKISDGRLLLRIPQADGTINEYPFDRGGIDQYNDAVKALQSSAASARTASSIAVDAARTAAAQAAAANQHTEDVAAAWVAVNNDVDHLNLLTSTMGEQMAAYDAAVSRDLNAAAARVTKAIAQQPLDCSLISYEVSGVRYSRSGVASERSYFDSLAERFSTAITTTKQDLARATGFEPDVNASYGTKAITNAAAALATAKDKATSYDRAADQTVTTAEAAERKTCPRNQ